MSRATQDHDGCRHSCRIIRLAALIKAPRAITTRTTCLCTSQNYVMTQVNATKISGTPPEPDHFQADVVAGAMLRSVTTKVEAVLVENRRDGGSSEAPTAAFHALTWPSIEDPGVTQEAAQSDPFGENACRRGRRRMVDPSPITTSICHGTCSPQSPRRENSAPRILYPDRRCARSLERQCRKRSRSVILEQQGPKPRWLLS
jgi:hypothetical protein